MRSPDIKGLTKLAEFLRRLPRKKFDQGTWITEGSDCGTKGCIAGWASYVFPYRFKRELDFIDSYNGRHYSVIHRRSRMDGPYAFAAAFHLNDVDAKVLCDSQASHQTPKQAARAIMRVVNRMTGKK